MKLNGIHEEIVKVLSCRAASYARPSSSDEIGRALNVSPSYVRGCIRPLVELRVVGVRRGRGGGYYLKRVRDLALNA
ncbi:MAG: Rrf2 family transcriptional regulator [Acetobacteraceae bacterium]|nr:Rrf2 family transcriptional regulator [Acetobacteraceae bacterium]